MFLIDQETSTDLLYYEAIARTVVRFVRETPSAPVTIGVHGDWGAGKSSVLKMTEDSFAKDKRVLCLWFNGWTFEGFDDAKTVVIETLIDELRRARPNSAKVAEAAKKLLKRVDWLKIARKSAGYAFTAVTGVPSLDQVSDVVGAVTAFLKKPQDQISVDDLKSVAGQAQDYLKAATEEVERLPEHIHAFRTEFSELIDAAEVDRLIVIVDDLDRCLPKTAIATLEAIRLFLMVPKTAFVIGADELMIEYAVKEHFPDLPPSSGPVGYARNYLEKLIQVPFRVPALGLAETRVYITLLLAELAMPAGDMRFQKLLDAAREDMARPWESHGLDVQTVQKALGSSTIPDEVREAQTISLVLTRLLTEGTHGNPRQIKRFLNSMMLRRAIAEERGFGGDIKLPVLGKIMLAERFYPDFYKQLSQLATAEKGMPAALAEFERRLKEDADVSVTSKKSRGAKSAGSKSSAKEDVAEAMSQEVADWLKNEWVKGWAVIDPSLTDIDLRPYVFVTRDKRGSLGGFAASAHLEAIVDRLSKNKLTARAAVDDVGRLSAQELDEVFSAVAERVMQSDEMKGEPDGVQGLIVLSERSTEMAHRLVEFASTLDIGKVGVWPVGMVANIKAAEVVPEAKALLSEWSEQTENPKLKQAVGLMTSIGKRV
ncbi:P-loop NTPase fold protein [Caballeronia sp. LZ008]|uniref:Qat anti-phage system ATPase QatA n=1 Tax=Caballeronia sp. LZ008 TaxID=3038560 RepID=UPI00285908EB|nr:Qat anti-phage system ATPase QatA [Caballeronia sp. LZ008]MDR5797978.1 P-loop NTPase fold protein [Caballeronia sp. LZ008]